MFLAYFIGLSSERPLGGAHGVAKADGRSWVGGEGLDIVIDRQTAAPQLKRHYKNSWNL